MSVFSFVEKHGNVLVTVFTLLAICLAIFDNRTLELTSSLWLIASFLVAPLFNGYFFRHHLDFDKLKSRSIWYVARVSLLPVVLASALLYFTVISSDLTDFSLFNLLFLLLSTFFYQVALVLAQFKYSYWKSVGVDYIIVGLELLASWVIHN